MPSVKIYDTTLRDGAQAEGISFSVEDKIKIALRLDKMGFHYIEGGWPGSNPKDLEFFKKIRHCPLRHARLAAFGSTRKAGAAAENDASVKAIIDSGVQVATIFGKSWDFHVFKALGVTLEENLAMIRETVAYLKSRGLEVIYDAEHFFDGCKANPAYALETIRAAAESGASAVVLCDTNGGTLPAEVKELVEKARSVLGVPVGIHAHNDGELAVANTLAAVQAGAEQVQGTVNGYGERCGNANLCSVIPNLTLKCGIETIPREKLVHLTDLSHFVSEVANISPNPHQPFVGASAFAHKGGVHVSALLKDSRTYEHISPGEVGNRRRVLVSELSGMSNLLYKYKELNLDIERQSPEGKRILEDIKKLESQGFQFEDAEGSFELLVRKTNHGYRDPFILEALRLLVEIKENTPAYSEAIIKMRVGDRVVHTAAEGNGPVNALDNALRKALYDFYPCIGSMHLTDYKVRVLEEKDGTGAAVRVHIQTGDGKRSWGTVGVSRNIIEASWQALADSISYGLLKGDHLARNGEEEKAVNGKKPAGNGSLQTN
ncbi:isopropylmalate/homocitrate/citramalate synthases [Pelotomaculum thermopropionicum SI]|uniref:Citramalate synthase n=1 Tax=Pelotomaculum thermopropionicum (strain DSM 13744 / JCM 10971 / SI) TaxID=370438 RepID=A5D4W4_PELTS|nr:isopropylmalate/homocitrate/citramalate synthases [Pelotomaculum thermopropionicum SI]